MSEETLLVLQALIGIVTVVGASFLTNWLNRKYFREQLGEQRFSEVHLDKMLDLWGEIQGILNETNTLFGEMAVTREEMLRKGSPQQKIGNELTRIYLGKLSPILVKVVALERYYILLREPTIDALKEFEEILTVTLREPGQHSFEEEPLKIVGELNDCSNKLVHQIRSDLVGLAERKFTYSEMLSSPVDVTPPHVAKVLQRHR